MSASPFGDMINSLPKDDPVRIRLKLAENEYYKNVNQILMQAYMKTVHQPPVNAEKQTRDVSSKNDSNETILTINENESD